MSNDYVYGSSGVNGEMFINVPLIWNDSKNEARFILNFSKVVHHETLHLEIYCAYEELGIEYSDILYEDREEDIVREITKTKSRYLK